MFGLEGILSNVALIVVVFQIARYFYTVLYEKNDRSWSPFVFISILLGVQVVYDLVLYYGVINNLKKGQSDIFDVLRAYVNEGGWHCILTDVIFMCLTALAAMVLDDTSDISKISLLMLVVFLIPYILSIPYKKPAPPPPPPKQETMKDARGF
jgi:L-cystine uptake protein TcyP (sodium:dicarboxylate symporter family)